jgi:hypothetical protein
MAPSKLVRLAGLVTMVGSFVFALGLLLRYSLGGTLAEALTLPMYFLLVVAASVAIVATAVLLRGTPRGGLGGLAGALSLVGVVLVFAGLLMGFLGLLVIPIGVVLATGGLGVMANLAVRAGKLPWWGGVALVAGFVPFLLLAFFYFPPLAHPLIGVPWLVVGYAIFRAAGGGAEPASRVR